MTKSRILVVATANELKLLELERLLGGLDLTLVAMGQLGLAPPVEDGDTFEDNALLKARAAAIASDRPAMADDSGLEVDALDGAPGVRSARWAGAHGDDRVNNDKLLAELVSVPDEERTARFVSAVAIVTPGGREWVVRGTMEGHILQAPDGNGGFGYDPLFVTDGETVSNGRLSPEDKDRLSHRGVAMRRIRPVLDDLFG